MAKVVNYLKKPFTTTEVTLNRDPEKAKSRRGAKGTGLDRETGAMYFE